MSRSPLFIIFLVVFIDLLGFGIVLPLLPRYGQHFQASELTLGLLMASFSAMQFLFAPLWGRLSDRIGRRPVLLIGLLGSTFSYLGFAQVTAWGNSGLIYGLSPIFWLFVTRIGAGISGATIATAQAYIADVTDAKNRGKGMALIGAAFGIGFTFGPLLGAMFVSGDPEQRALTHPSPAPGYVAAILSAGAFLCALVMLPESLKSQDRSATWRVRLDRAALQAAIAKPYIGPLLLSIFLTTFAFAQFESTLSLLNKQLGLSDRWNFVVFAYIGLVLTLAQGLLVRRLIPQLGEFWMALAGVGLMTGGLWLLGWASQQGSVWWLLAVLPICVIGYSATTPALQSLLSRNAGSDEQGGVLGLGQSVSALARIFGPAIGLPLHGWSTALPYWVGAGLMGLSCGLVLSLRGAMFAHPARAESSPVHAGGPTVAPVAVAPVATPVNDGHSDGVNPSAGTGSALLPPPVPPPA